MLRGGVRRVELVKKLLTIKKDTQPVLLVQSPRQIVRPMEGDREKEQGEAGLWGTMLVGLYQVSQ